MLFNNAEPAYKTTLVRLCFAHSQLFLGVFLVCVGIEMQIKRILKVEHTDIDLTGEKNLMMIYICL